MAVSLASCPLCRASVDDASTEGLARHFQGCAETSASAWLVAPRPA